MKQWKNSDQTNMEIIHYGENLAQIRSVSRRLQFPPHPPWYAPFPYIHILSTYVDTLIFIDFLHFSGFPDFQ